jgi:hypothetical protein
VNQPTDGLRGGARYALAWAALALINGLRILGQEWPAGGAEVRALHHAFDAGQLLAAGLGSWALASAWGRLTRDRAALHGVTLMVLLGLSLWVSGGLLVEDLRGPAERLAESRGWDGEGEPQPWLGLMVVAVAGLVPAAWGVGRLAARPGLRWLAVALALAVGVGHEAVLDGAYPAAHLILAWCAATFSGAALWGVAVPWRLPRAWLLSAPLAVGGAAALFVWPSNAVLMEMDQLDGAVLLPVVARAHIAAAGAPQIGLAATEQGFQPPTPPSGPPLMPPGAIVILITIDSLRADLLPRPDIAAQLPTLSALRVEGVDFAQARSTAAGTRLAMAGIFASRLWSQLPWTNPASGRPVIKNDPSPRLPELLNEVGVQTVQFISEFRALVDAAGLARGFSEAQVLRPPAGSGQDYALSPQMMNAAIERLRRQGPQPLFLYMHLMDPHSPYDAVTTDCEPFKCYLAELALVDRELARLQAAVEAAGLGPRTALIIGADHGEAFGQHGVKYHNGTLYEELVHVPLLFSIPGVKARRVTEPVTLLDLGPTILDLMGAATPNVFRGESLVPWLRGETVTHIRPIAIERKDVKAMVFEGRHKVILDRRKHREEIYDLRADPHELDNLRDRMGARGDALVAEVRAFYDAESTTRALIDQRRAEARAKRRRTRARKAKKKRILHDFKMPDAAPGG